MQNRIFRQVALERLSSPERLDELMAVTSPRGWLALLGLCTVILAAGVWGIYGSVPTLVRGQGILIREGSLQTVDAPASGQVKEIFVRLGELVERDQVVAQLVQPTDNQSIIVTSPFAGRVLEVRVTDGNFVPSGTPLLSLEQPGRPLEVVLYLPPVEAKKVQPGMAVHISPASVKREEHGLLLGQVVSVGGFPATLAGMRRALGSEELAKSLSTGGPPIEVRVELERDATTATGYQWTSTQASLGSVLLGWLPGEWSTRLAVGWTVAGGPPITLESGTLCTADVITDEQPPIYLVLAKLNQ